MSARLPEDVAGFLDRAFVPARIACGGGPDAWPLIASLWFLREGDAIYCATPASAAIARRLAAEPRCAVEVSTNLAPYRGVRLRARAHLDASSGQAMLERLIVRYLGDARSDLAAWLLGRSVEEVAIRLEPEHVSTWDFSARMAAAAPVYA